jgi:hypothetical protein
MTALCEVVYQIGEQKKCIGQNRGETAGQRRCEVYNGDVTTTVQGTSWNTSIMHINTLETSFLDLLATPRLQIRFPITFP